RNAARVATASDEHPPFTPHVVARIECPPAITQINLHPGGEVHRKLKGRDLDLGQIAENVTSGGIEGAAERTREVCEVPADSITAGMYICGRGYRCAGAVFKADVIMHVIADRLDSTGAGRRAAETAPRCRR